ncbi:MAG: 50S ribosomal protein L17 [Planctomycetota bacterium]|nr:MAG: 50S ribosomal protein L17 [Planctomycetota bacterium]
MRHAVRGRKLNRSPAHRLALKRNLAQSLIEHGEIRTTLQKAREVRPFVEKLFTLAIDGSLAARQRATALLNDRAIIRKENREDYDRMTDAKRAQVLRSRSGRRYRAVTTRPGVPFTAESVIHRLFSEIGPALRKRNEARGSSGGYTRIIKLADRRLGDGGLTAILQIVSEDDAPRAKGSDKTERKRRARVRYAFYAGKAAPQRRKRKASARDAASDDAPASQEASSTATAEAEPPASDDDQS